MVFVNIEVVVVNSRNTKNTKWSDSYVVFSKLKKYQKYKME